MLGKLLLDKYRVIRQFDEGGMSKIYLARQENPAREVIVKVLKESLRSQTKAVEHFCREIYIMSRFHHPNSVEVYDSATRSPLGPIMVMEYLRGIDMAGLLAREGRFTPDRTGKLLVQLCDVLQAAHERGIVHRDLKPGNLMILHNGTPLESVKLMDFGLAKMSSLLYISPEDLVDFNLPPASGTPEYISPEMVRGIDLDGRGDLYSVGVMLFEMLTGRRPFQYGSIEKLMLAHANEPPPSFASVGCRDLVPPAIETVVLSCLAKHPEQRPATARDLAQAYERALGRRIIVPRFPAKAAPPKTAPASTTAPATTPTAAAAPPPPVDRNALRHSVEANMPEAMAMLKLRGFVYDLGGEVIESVPGMIKVRLLDREAEKKKEGLLGWTLGNSRIKAATATNQSTDIELHMERRDPTQPSKLTITLLMRPGAGLATTEWRNRCSQICRDLQAYLMGR